MRKWLNTWFDLTTREFNGLLALFILIFVILLTPYTFTWFLPKEKPRKEDGLAIRKLELREMVRKKAYRHYPTTRNRPQRKQVLFNFDPNHLDLDGWQRLGLSVKQAQAVVNYAKKGGKFYDKEDVKKMYTISPQLYAQLEPFIKISNTDTVLRYHKRYEAGPRVVPVFDINSADTLQLQEISGIGPVFARRIAKYRARLGGYYKVAQLLEVYGIDSVKFEEIKGQVKVGSGGLHQININRAEFEDLRNHPYLKYKQVNAIIQYRKQHGNYTSFADLKKVAILSAETVDNLAPYLSF